MKNKKIKLWKVFGITILRTEEYSKEKKHFNKINKAQQKIDLLVKKAEALKVKNEIK